MSDDCEHLLCGTRQEDEGDWVVWYCRGCGQEMMRKSK